jgi:hypothetical protein
MAKQIVTGENSRQAILRGANILAKDTDESWISFCCDCGLTFDLRATASKSLPAKAV